MNHPNTSRRIIVALLACILLTACPSPPPPPPPPPPVVHSLTLTWTAVTGTIKGYDIFIGTAPGAESATPVNPSPVTTTFFSTTNVTVGVAYYCIVEVAAVNGKLGPKSTEVEGTIP